MITLRLRRSRLTLISTLPADTAPAMEWLTRREAAEYLRVSTRWLASADGRATVPYFKFGNQVRYSKTELDKWARAQRAS
ncbi:helix-turn-helix domain-containing protein [Glutamicibacter sp. MNS18]|uniref:helix-turn-helix domain-containing protein n=1 Tax=Glutamicibacter sp. MNS18 TaxID=2989817 RepID=UPI0035322D58